MKKVIVKISIVLLVIFANSCNVSESAIKDNNSSAKSSNQSQELNNRVVDISLHPIKIEKAEYSFELISDTLSPKNPSKSTISIWGSFEKLKENDKIVFEINKNYPEYSKMQVIAKDKKGNIIGKSKVFEFTKDIEDINFGEIKTIK